jgi:adenylosuccinate lyase
MSTHLTLLSTAARLLTLFGAAGNAAAAAEFGRQPRNRTLEVLGIDPEHYRQIRR